MLFTKSEQEYIKRTVKLTGVAASVGSTSGRYVSQILTGERPIKSQLSLKIAEQFQRILEGYYKEEGIKVFSLMKNGEVKEDGIITEDQVIKRCKYRKAAIDLWESMEVPQDYYLVEQRCDKGIWISSEGSQLRYYELKLKRSENN